MKNLIYIILLMFTVVLSCDGRDKVHQTSQEVLKNNKLYESFSQKVVYIPEHYLETKNDTILSNGFQVKLKSYTNMRESFLKKSIKNHLLLKNYYRDIETTILIKKNEQNIVSTNINKDFFMNSNKEFHRILKDKILQGVWLNQYASIITNTVVLEVQFMEPETKNYVYYRVSFDQNGGMFINDNVEEKFS